MDYKEWAKWGGRDYEAELEDEEDEEALEALVVYAIEVKEEV